MAQAQEVNTILGTIIESLTGRKHPLPISPKRHGRFWCDRCQVQIPAFVDVQPVI